MKLFRKAVLTAAAVLSVLSANAEGYQINSQSARQTGMGHTGTALKLGAESMLFNPAGMSFMNSKFDISLGTIGIKSKVKFNGMGSKTETDNPMSTPIFGYIGYKPCNRCKRYKPCGQLNCMGRQLGGCNNASGGFPQGIQHTAYSIIQDW